MVLLCTRHVVATSAIAHRVLKTKFKVARYMMESEDS